MLTTEQRTARAQHRFGKGKTVNDWIPSVEEWEHAHALPKAEDGAASASPTLRVLAFCRKFPQTCYLETCRCIHRCAAVPCQS